MSSNTPTLAQRVASLEALHQDLWERMLSPGTLTGEQVNAALLLELVTQNAQILSALQGAASGGGSGATGPGVVLTVSFPLAPGETNSLIAATPKLSGYRAGAAVQFPTLVPAGGAVTVTIPPPPSNVMSLLGVFRVATSDVGASVKVQATQDGAPLIGTEGFTLGPELHLPVPGYMVTTGLVIDFTNPSAADVTVWLSGLVLTLTTQFYDAVLSELQNQAWTMVEKAFGIVLPT